MLHYENHQHQAICSTRDHTRQNHAPNDGCICFRLHLQPPSNRFPFRRLRRLSQLRAYTHIHFSPLPSSSAPSHSPLARVSSNEQNRLTRRHTLSGRRLSWFSRTDSHQPSTTCPDSTTEPSTLARYGAILFPGYRSLEVDLRSSTQPSESSSSSSTSDFPTQQAETMPRLRPSQTAPETQRELQAVDHPAPTAVQPVVLDSPDPVIGDSSASGPKHRQGATIRFFPYQDTSQSSRPSLPFIPISRTLPSGTYTVRVGRYSERDGMPIANPAGPSDAPVGFKSKVVSRKHCEFLFLNSQWHIKDVGSSSGTFLNHMRLSQPGMPSRLYTVKDGDIVQLGIDFRGGEEMIFRCVRIRIECNRSWQQQPNEFNKNTESLIKNLGKGDAVDYSGCRECSICLGSVLRPYQCLFMAACAHVWHYKCVSRLIHTPDYPMFQCPNCRAYTDLSAEVDDTNDLDDEQSKEASQNAEEAADELGSGASSPQLEPSQGSITSELAEDQPPTLPTAVNLASNIENMHLSDGNPSDVASDAPTSTSAPSNSSPDVPGWQSLTQSSDTRHPRPAQLRVDTPVRSESSDENPLTPRNDSGPLAFDGRAGMS
ncbi:hypothetical protein ARAM_000438 [Aspergillus rambellii]|uniref:FHA domain protein n=1 Tax=Aspergillus rambellii TaxID=308745 RepID=A0A0F8VVP9_9EURO|nr:hypothetical protein ARAM_000438 [Aspergillus rambellii]